MCFSGCVPNEAPLLHLHAKQSGERPTSARGGGRAELTRLPPGAADLSRVQPSAPHRLPGWCPVAVPRLAKFPQSRRDG